MTCAPPTLVASHPSQLSSMPPTTAPVPPPVAAPATHHHPAAALDPVAHAHGRMDSPAVATSANAAVAPSPGQYHHSYQVIKLTLFLENLCYTYFIAASVHTICVHYNAQLSRFRPLPHSPTIINNSSQFYVHPVDSSHLNSTSAYHPNKPLGDGATSSDTRRAAAFCGSSSSTSSTHGPIAFF